MQFLKVPFVKSTMYPVAQFRQFTDCERQPEQLIWQVPQMFVRELAKVSDGQFTAVTQVLVTEFRNVPEGQEVHVRASETHVLHWVEHRMQMFPGSG